MKQNWLKLTGAGSVVAGLIGLVGLIGAGFWFGWPEWTGMGSGKSVSITTERDAQGDIIKTVKTVAEEPGKTLWDWLGVLGVPLTLALLGYVFQQQQQNLIDDEAREEVLQGYFSWLSEFMSDKRAMGISEDDGIVIQARTLSVLRRLENDPERKGFAVRFLADQGITKYCFLRLTKADLMKSDLSGTTFDKMSLWEADLRQAVLSGAILKEVHLSEAKLGRTDLRSAVFRGVQFREADLRRARLNDVTITKSSFKDHGTDRTYSIITSFEGANLGESDLRGAISLGSSFEGANLKGADLRGAIFENTDFVGANLTGAKLNDAVLMGVDMSQVEGLTIKQLTQEPRPLLCGVKLPSFFVKRGISPTRDCDSDSLREVLEKDLKLKPKAIIEKIKKIKQQNWGEPVPTKNNSTSLQD